MKKLIILSLILITSCYNEKREWDSGTIVPWGEGINADKVILRQEHTVTGSAKIQRSVSGKFDRTDNVTNNVLVEIDTLYRSDIIHIKRETTDEVNTELYVTVYRSDTLFEILWKRSYINNINNEKTYHLGR